MTQFGLDEREVLALVGEAKAAARRNKASIQWQMVLDDALTVIRQGGERWRSSFVPLVAGVVLDAGDYWSAQTGLQFDLRNLQSEAWFINYMQHFANPITATSEREIAAVMQQGLREGWSIDEMSNHLQTLFRQWINGDVTDTDWAFAEARIPPHRAELIARTETTRATNAGSHEIYQGAGVERKIWQATNDDRTRDSHASASGQVQPINLPFKIGSSEMMYPGDASLGAPVSEFANCRCTVLPDLDT